MIKIEKGTHIVLTYKDLKESSKNKAIYDCTLDGFNINGEDIEMADCIEGYQIMKDGTICAGKILKINNSLNKELSELWEKNNEAYSRLGSKGIKKIQSKKWWHIFTNRS